MSDVLDFGNKKQVHVHFRVVSACKYVRVVSACEYVRVVSSWTSKRFHNLYLGVVSAALLFVRNNRTVGRTCMISMLGLSLRVVSAGLLFLAHCKSNSCISEW